MQMIVGTANQKLGAGGRTHGIQKGVPCETAFPLLQSPRAPVKLHAAYDVD